MLIYFVKPWNGGWRKGKTTLPRFHRWQFITTLHATLRILSTFVNVRFARQNGQFGSFICQLPKYALDIVEESKILDQGKIVKKFKELTKNNWESLDQYWSLNSYKKMIFEKSSYSFTELEKRVARLLHSQIRITNPFIMKRTLALKKGLKPKRVSNVHGSSDLKLLWKITFILDLEYKISRGITTFENCPKSLTLIFT